MREKKQIEEQQEHQKDKQEQMLAFYMYDCFVIWRAYQAYKTYLSDRYHLIQELSHQVEKEELNYSDEKLFDWQDKIEKELGFGLSDIINEQYLEMMNIFLRLQNECNHLGTHIQKQIKSKQNKEENKQEHQNMYKDIKKFNERYHQYRKVGKELEYDFDRLMRYFRIYRAYLFGIKR